MDIVFIALIRVLCFSMSIGALVKAHGDAKENDIAGVINDGTWAIVYTLLLILTYLVWKEF